jgi:hypothetical protein
MTAFTRAAVLAPTALLILLALPAPAALAGTLVIQPDALNGKDAEIVNGSFGGVDYANENRGTSTALVSNFQFARSVGLLQFDLSALPVDAVITSATLTLFQAANNNQGRRYDVFRVTSDWAEATVTFNTRPTYDTNAVASLLIPDDSPSAPRDWLITSLAQGWAAGSFSNFGMWIEEIPVQGDGSAIFRSSDEGIQANRPKLTITYNAVPEPSSLMLASLSIGLASLALGRRRTAAL